MTLSRDMNHEQHTPTSQEPLVRSRYFPRQLVTAADLSRDQNYFRERLRQHHRLLHGCGVICGLLAELITDESGETPQQHLEIEPGSAIDPQGNVIEVPHNVTVSVEQLCLLTHSGDGRSRQRDWALPSTDRCLPGDLTDQTYYLALCYREESSHPQPAIRGDRCGGITVCEDSRLHDSYELVLLDAITTEDCTEHYAEADDPAWFGEYYPFPTSTLPPDFPETPPVLTRYDPVIDFDWGMDSPAFGLEGDFFMVRWTRDLYFPAGTYQFVAEINDGARLWVDDVLYVDEWQGRIGTVTSEDVVLSAGTHHLRLEYYERRDSARIRLHWRVVQQGWHAEYYQYAQPEDSEAVRNTPPEFPDRPPDVMRTEATLDLNLRAGQTPHDSLYHNYFLVRWTREIEVCHPAEYEFVLLTTDGSRLWVDGEMLVNEWHPQGPTSYRPRVMLAAGKHHLQVDHYERRGGEIVRLTWQPVGAYNPPCMPRAHGCVVLAALSTQEGAFTHLDNFWFDRQRGQRRKLLTPTSDLTRSLHCWHRPPGQGAIAQITPGEGVQGSTLTAMIFGQGLTGTTAVTFSGSGVAAIVQPGGTDSWVPITITIDPDATPGLRTFQLRTQRFILDSQTFDVRFRVVGLEPPTTTPPVVTTTPPIVITTTPPVVTTTPPIVIITTTPPLNTLTPPIGTTLPVFTGTPDIGLPINTGIIDQPVIDQPVIDQPVIDQPVIDRSMINPPIDTPIALRPLSSLDGISPDLETPLANQGITNTAELAALEPQQLANLLNISEVRAMGLIDRARRMR